MSAIEDVSAISFTVTQEHTSAFFGRLTVSNIHPKFKVPIPVKVNKFLYIKFKSPAKIGNSDVNVVTHPWVDITPDISNDQLDAKTFLVKAKLNFKTPYTFNGSETITFYVNGNLDNDPHNLPILSPSPPIIPFSLRTRFGRGHQVGSWIWWNHISSVIVTSRALGALST